MAAKWRPSARNLASERDNALNSNCPIERYPVVKKLPAAVTDERCDHTIQIMFKGETDGANNEIGLSIPRATRFPRVRRGAISFQSPYFLPIPITERSLPRMRVTPFRAAVGI